MANAFADFWSLLKTIDEWRNDVKMTCMETLPKMDISDELNARFQPPPLWLEDRIREAIANPAEAVTLAQFEKNMKVISDGR